MMSKHIGLSRALPVFLLAAASEVLAWPAGFSELSGVGGPNLRILTDGNNGVAMYMTGPAMQDSFDEESVKALMTQITCGSHEVSADRKTLTGTECVQKGDNGNQKVNLYATIDGKNMRMVVYTTGISLATAKEISKGQ